MFSHTEKLFADAKAAVRVPGNIRQVDVKIAVEGPILEFKGLYSWLSNFYPTTVEVGGYIYPASENAFMAGKSVDPSWKEFCTKETNPGAIKSAGRKVKLIEGWDELRIDVMLTALRAKFSNTELKAKLIATGDRQLIEGNQWGDKFWGVCIKTSNHTGQNNLGKLLMKVRSELQQ